MASAASPLAAVGGLCLGLAPLVGEGALERVAAVDVHVGGRRGDERGWGEESPLRERAGLLGAVDRG